MTTTTLTHPFQPLDPGALMLGNRSAIGDDTGHNDAFGVAVRASYAVRAVLPTIDDGLTTVAATVVGWGPQPADDMGHLPARSGAGRGEDPAQVLID